MEIKIKRDHFLKALSQSGRATTNNSVIPAMGMLLISVPDPEKEDKKIEVTGASEELFIRCFIDTAEAEIIESGSVAVDKRIISIVKNFNTEIIELKSDNNVLIVKSGRSKYKIPAISAMDYPRIDFSYDNQFDLDASMLKEALETVVPFASSQENRPALTGIHMIGSENHIVMTGTDSYRLSRVRINAPDVHDFDVIVYAQSAKKILPYITNGKVTFGFKGSNRVVLKMEDMIIAMRLIDATYPDTDRLFNLPTNAKVSAKRNDIVDALSRIAVVTPDNPHSVTFDLGKMILSSSTDVGSADEEIDGTHEGETYEVSFNYRYLQDALKVVPFTDDVCLEFTGEMRPIKIFVNRDDNFETSQTILPIRTH